MMVVATQAIRGVVFLHGNLSFGSITKPYPHTKSLHDVVSGPSIFFRKKSCLVPKCLEKKAAQSGLTYDDGVKRKFVEVFEVLKLELLNDPVIEWSDQSRQWLEHMMDYNVFPGKLFRGVSVIDCFMSLKEGKDLTQEELFSASILGWSVEWLQAAILVLDDIMDNSANRRGEACWYRVPKVGKSIAINDGVVLLKQVPRILRKYFTKKPYYVDLLNLFNEVEYQTFLGQMMDVTTTVDREKDLSKYSLTLHHRIAQYKTSYYSFYLPVACALLLAGEDLDNHANVKDVLIDMGIYFQVVNDYQDCFGDPNKTGKIGTDIEDFKFSWLILQALELCSEEQKKTLLEHYGKKDSNDIAKVKAVYDEIDLKSVFAIYERKNYDKLRRTIEAHPCKAVQAIGARYLNGLDQWL